MKPYENPDNAYAKAIELERKSVEAITVSLHKGKKVSWLKISSIISGAAAILIVGFIMIQQKKNLIRLDLAREEIAALNLQKAVVETKNAKAIQDFNASVQGISTAKVIQNLNASFSKFTKSNNQTL